MTTTESTAEKPSASRVRLSLRVVSLLLIGVGIIVSGYISYTELTKTAIQCIQGTGFNCEVVQSSVYSKLAGIPVAYLGFATYLFLGALLLLENRIAFLQDNGVMIVFGITLFAFLYSMWLVYVQAVLLEAFCPWCLTHELAMTLLFVVSGLRMWKSLRGIDEKRKEPVD